MERSMDGRKNGETDGRKDGQTDVWAEGRTDGCMDEGRTDGWLRGGTDGWMNGRMDVQTDGMTVLTCSACFGSTDDAKQKCNDSNNHGNIRQQYISQR